MLFTIPLRRAMVTTSDLPYPEGVAAAEVLEVGSRAREAVADGAQSETREGLLAVVYGAVASAALAAFAATQIAAGEVTGFFRVRANSISGYDMSFSLALVGAGYLVGISVGMAMLLGLLIAWAAAVPILTSLQGASSADIGARAMDVWHNDVRFIGAGAIGVAAIWTLLKLAGPVVQRRNWNNVRLARTRARDSRPPRHRYGASAGLHADARESRRDGLCARSIS